MSWPMVKLGELLVDVQPGFASGQDLDEGTLQIRMNNVKPDGSWDWSKKRYVPATDKQKEKYSLICGDIVFNSTNSTEQVGKSAIYSTEIEQTVCFSNHFLRLRTDQKKLIPEYLNRYLSYLWNLRVFENMVDAWVNQASVRRDDFLKIELPLPPLEEQKRIATILDKADAIHQKRQKAIELADEFLRSVFLDMFGDPVTNPKGWDVESLSSLIHIQGGYAFKSTDFGSEGIPVVKIGNANKKGFTAENIDFIQPALPEKLKQYELFPSDLLMSLTGTVGKDDYGNITEVTAEYNKYYLNQRVAKLSVKSNKINKDYLNFCLSHQSMKNELIKNNRGVRQANINNSDIYELEIPVADMNIQHNFSKVVGKMKSVVQSLIKTEPLINSTFASLSKKAFSGEL